MIVTVHVHSKVEKMIAQMKRLDNAPKIAGLRAEKIIRALISGAGGAMAGQLSKWKDSRVRNLYKFDLGKGFRLVAVKEPKAFYILFLGNHDQCDRWLDTYRKKKPHKVPMSLNAYGVLHEKKKQTPENCHPEDLKNDDDLPDVTQADLRRVFCGLAGDS